MSWYIDIVERKNPNDPFSFPPGSEAVISGSPSGRPFYFQTACLIYDYFSDGGEKWRMKKTLFRLTNEQRENKEKYNPLEAKHPALPAAAERA